MMKLFFALNVSLITCGLLSLIRAEKNVLTISGSGTTNPQNCFGLITQQFQDRASIPIRITYRGVGSGTGITEFLGINNTGNFAYVPYNDFASGDIPISTAQYNSAKAAIGGDSVIIHLPFMAGAVSFFHNIPGVSSGPGGLNLTGCLLAQIFKRQITTWDHPDIVKYNEGLTAALPSANYSIKVAHRVLGSSSTFGITSYLYKSCPAHWNSTDVGASIKWPTDTLSCDGSDLMVECILNNEGTIGYVESGRGWQDDLKEIQLRNHDNYTLSSYQASLKNGIYAAINKTYPSSFDQDFGDVEAFDEPGEYTWPIVVITYVFVRKDIYKFVKDPAEAGLLKLFLLSLYRDDYIGQCKQFGFILVPDHVKASAITAINETMQWTDPNSTTASIVNWSIEKDTLPIAGQGAYVISSKRRTGTEYAISSAVEVTGDVNDSVTALKNEIERLKQARTYTDKDRHHVKAALVLSALSFTFCMTFMLFALCKRFLFAKSGI